MKNCKNVPYYTFGDGSVSLLKEILDKKESEENSKIVFMIDDFFCDRGIRNKLHIKGQDIMICVSTKKEPEAEYIDRLTNEIKTECINKLPAAIVGMGGGTVMDIAKSVSILLTNPGKAEDYQGWDLVKNPAIYKIGIPTISGSGAEASRTAVLTSKKAKLGINSDYSMFDQIILDPTFLKTVPKDQFVFTAMDCYVHDVELLRGDNNELTKSFADKSLQLLREIFLLEDMNYNKLMIASYLGGCAMATASGGHVCHPVSYGLGFVLGYRHAISVCLAFNQLGEYYPAEIKEFKEIISKFTIELPKNIMKGATEEQLDKMAEATLKNDKPLRSAFGDNWKDIFTKDKVKEILLRI